MFFFHICNFVQKKIKNYLCAYKYISTFNNLKNLYVVYANRKLNKKKILFFYLKIIYFLYKFINLSPKTNHLVSSIFLYTKFNFLIFFKKKYFYKSNVNHLATKLNSSRKKFNKKKIFLYSYIFKLYSFIWWKKNISIYNNFFTKKLYSITFNSCGSYILEPLAWGIYYNITTLPPSYYFLLNIPVPLGFNNYIYYFIYSYYYYSLIWQKKKFATSAGTFLKLLYFDNIEKLCFVKLPSNKIKVINFFGYVYVGRNSNIYINKIIKGGFFSKHLSFKQCSHSTRGISKNPVDHPNGGRTNTKNPKKTPWGLIAKKSK